MRDDTLVIFSSDNGPVLFDAYEDNSIELAGDHKPAGPLRGGKYSSYDGGTRVPFILSYPREVETGESDALLSHVDFYASFAALLGQTLPDDAAPDSFNVLAALFGRSGQGRESLVLEGSGRNTVFRHGDWTFIPPKDGPRLHYSGIELGNSPEAQLYDLSLDIGQIRNVADEKEDLVAELSTSLEKVISSHGITMKHTSALRIKASSVPGSRRKSSRSATLT